MKDLPNLALPTLGGRQFWMDRRIRHGWRIQQQSITGHFRLLDPHDRRQAWGSLASCQRRLDALLPTPVAAALDAKPAVVLLHGLMRSRAIWRPLATRLREAGYEVLDVAYPSGRARLHDHVAQVEDLLTSIPGQRRISFVTHSLGGIVARSLLADTTVAWRQRHQCGRLVMLFPPNRGSQLADDFSGSPLLRLVTGPIIDELTTASMARLPPPACPFLVIAGGQGNGRGYNPLIDGDDDGVVGVHETYATTAEGHLVFPVSHSFGMNDSRVIQAILAYLQDGTIRSSGP